MALRFYFLSLIRSVNAYKGAGKHSQTTYNAVRVQPYCRASLCLLGTSPSVVALYKSTILLHLVILTEVLNMTSFQTDTIQTIARFLIGLVQEHHFASPGYSH